MVYEEFGPEQVKAEAEACGDPRAAEVRKINEAISRFTPVISHWLKRAFNAGFNSTADTKEKGWETFCKLNGVVDDNP